ncbi:hypothetical protein M408DRAFT_327040 [Serendipita vermifera MAFF 305830]|uniref:Uncharacterized protein n=1 Tax=Serendipita vermifera MAFF 305830 TaxID=933852 RepID=A0A0C2X2J9_SERVB|nr:hypothetical protein M408DRAFT_327040 [Serendipita vermifera MAFF 305830]
MPRVCFGVEDRAYGSRFATSPLINLAPGPNFPGHFLKWVFIFQNTGSSFDHDPWLYGFTRCKEGRVVDILDLDGFIEALYTECPDLPPVTGYTGSVKECKAPADHRSFYERLRWLLDLPFDDDEEERAVVYHSERERFMCRFITVEQASEVIAAFDSKGNEETGEFLPVTW